MDLLLHLRTSDHHRNRQGRSWLGPTRTDATKTKAKSDGIKFTSLVGSFGDSTRDIARTPQFLVRDFGNDHLASMNVFQTSLGGQCDNAIGDACAASDTH